MAIGVQRGEAPSPPALLFRQHWFRRSAFLLACARRYRARRRLDAFDADPFSVEHASRVLYPLNVADTAVLEATLGNVLKPDAAHVLDERVRVVHPLMGLKVLERGVHPHEDVAAWRTRAPKQHASVH